MLGTDNYENRNVNGWKLISVYYLDWKVLDAGVFWQGDAKTK